MTDEEASDLAQWMLTMIDLILEDGPGSLAKKAKAKDLVLAGVHLVRLRNRR